MVLFLLANFERCFRVTERKVRCKPKAYCFVLLVLGLLLFKTVRGTQLFPSSAALDRDDFLWTVH